jgi:hypothetical protein
VITQLFNPLLGLLINRVVDQQSSLQCSRLRNRLRFLPGNRLSNQLVVQPVNRRVFLLFNRLLLPVLSHLFFQVVNQHCNRPLTLQHNPPDFLLLNRAGNPAYSLLLSLPRNRVLFQPVVLLPSQQVNQPACHPPSRLIFLLYNHPPYRPVNRLGLQVINPLLYRPVVHLRNR